MRFLSAPKKLREQGFTLIELVVVMGVLAVLLAITIVAVNPQKQFNNANDTQRQSDINAILNAVHQYAADNKGAYPAGLTSTATNITNSGGVDLCSNLVPTYIASMPVDPSNGTYTDCSSYSTGYKVASTSGRITVSATKSDGTSLTVTR